MTTLDKNKNPWTTESSELKYDNPWIRVTEHKVIHPSGDPGIYGTLHFKNLAIAILPIDEDDHTWLVGQYRYPLSQYSWEIPEGGGKIGIDPLDSAKRELKEETGLVATHWTPILEMHLSNSVSDERSISYLAEGLTQEAAAPESSEELQVKRVSFDKVLKMVLDGEISDSLSVATILKAHWIRTHR